jgi:hypothetical protein
MARRGNGAPMVSSTTADGGLPRPVYEALPLIYLAMAIVLVVMVDSPVIFLSSALFGAAGVGVLWMRMRHRRAA